MEFEQGDLTRPVWTGCWVRALRRCPGPGARKRFDRFNDRFANGRIEFISIKDAPRTGGGIHIKTATGAMLSITDAGITISNGKGAVIAMNGPAVTINHGALAII